MCNACQHEKIENDSGSEEKLSRDCWTKPAIKRAVILIIDALRYINITMLDVVFGSLPFSIRLCWHCTYVLTHLAAVKQGVVLVLDVRY